MKKSFNSKGIILVLTTIIFFASEGKAQNTNTADTVTLSATEMGCAEDSKLVAKALYRKKGVKSVTINGEEIVVVYNPLKVKAEELKQVVETTGTCEDPEARVHKVRIKSN